MTARDSAQRRSPAVSQGAVSGDGPPAVHDIVEASRWDAQVGELFVGVGHQELAPGSRAEFG